MEYTSQAPCQMHLGISGHPVQQLNAKDCAKWQSAISLRCLALDLTGNEIPIRYRLDCPTKAISPNGTGNWIPLLYPRMCVATWDIVA